MIINGRPSILDGPTMLNEYVMTTSTLGALSSTLSDQEIRDMMVKLWMSNSTEAQMRSDLLEIMKSSQLTFDDISKATTVSIKDIQTSVGIKPQVMQLTPDIAKEIVYKSMTGGIDQYYVDQYGGIDYIMKTASSAGMQQDTASIVAYEQENNLRPSLHTLINTGTPDQVVENVIEYRAMSEAEKNVFSPPPIQTLLPNKQTIKPKSEFAIAFHNYIYSDTKDATVATDNGLYWYLKNKEIYGLTPQSFVDLWNESEGTMFTVADLNTALDKLPIDLVQPYPIKEITDKIVDTDVGIDKPIVTEPVPITINKTTGSNVTNTAVVPLLAIAAALYFGIGA